MLSWKALSLVVAAAVAMNGVVGLEQGYGGGIWTAAPTTDTPTTSPPTSTESSNAQQSGNEEYSQYTNSDGDDSASIDTGSQVDGSFTSDIGSDRYPGTTPSPDSSYGNSLSWDGSQITGGTGSFPGGKITSGDGSVYIDVPSESVDGSSASDVGSSPPGKGGVSLPSSVSGSNRDSSTEGDNSNASTGSDDNQTPSTGGCQVRTRRLRQKNRSTSA